MQGQVGPGSEGRGRKHSASTEVAGDHMEAMLKELRTVAALEVRTEPAVDLVKLVLLAGPPRV